MYSRLAVIHRQISGPFSQYTPNISWPIPFCILVFLCLISVSSIQWGDTCLNCLSLYWGLRLLQSVKSELQGLYYMFPFSYTWNSGVACCPKLEKGFSYNLSNFLVVYIRKTNLIPRPYAKFHRSLFFIVSIKTLANFSVM